MSMDFCDECGSMLTPKRVDGKVVISCPKCGDGKEMKKEDQLLTQEVKRDGKESMVVIENPDEFNTMPTKPMKCSKCNYNWQSRIKEPKACPRCKTRLDYLGGIKNG